MQCFCARLYIQLNQTIEILLNIFSLTFLIYLCVEHLLRELRHCHGPVLLTSPGVQRGKARHEEMEPGEGDHVHGQLAEVGVQLAGEAEACRDARHGNLVER